MEQKGLRGFERNAAIHPLSEQDAIGADKPPG
jgi:hypothetical protein